MDPQFSLGYFQALLEVPPSWKSFCIQHPQLSPGDVFETDAQEVFPFFFFPLSALCGRN